MQHTFIPQTNRLTFLYRIFHTDKRVATLRTTERAKELDRYGISQHLLDVRSMNVRGLCSPTTRQLQCISHIFHFFGFLKNKIIFLKVIFFRKISHFLKSNKENLSFRTLCIQIVYFDYQNAYHDIIVNASINKSTESQEKVNESHW